MSAEDIMHARAATIGGHETLTAAGKYIRDMGGGALPILGDDLAVVEQHQTRRLPMVGHHRLLGIISQAHLARHLPEDQIASFVNAICAP